LLLNTSDMKENDGLIRVFTGTEVTVNLLKGELEAIGITSLIQNDFLSGITSGFAGGAPSAIDLFIQEHDLETAKPVIDEFVRINN
jgi:Putative prokaryotic signal transducing protein